MDEQEILHKISVETDINIELLKDVIHDENLLQLIRAKKKNNAIMYLHANYTQISLGGAKLIVEAFAEALK